MLVFPLLMLGVLTACDVSPEAEPEAVAEAPAVKQQSQPPNLIVILADDIGVETVGAYGSEYATPSIDSIGANGIRFDAAHATPICTPSRVRLLTGRYSYKNYVDFSVLAPGEITMAHELRDAGYRTLVAGKWQLAGTGDEDDPPGVSPEDAGFDEHLVWHMQREDKGSRFWAPRLLHNGVFIDHSEDEFGPTIVNQRVLDFIGEEHNQPFFVYYSMLLAHKPWVTTPISPDAESDKDRFTGMMGYMDLMVGRLLETLETEGLLENTVIFFIGDNGTHPDITSLRNGAPVQGGKWKTSDTGTHVPFLAQWPGMIPAGGSSDVLVDLIDVMPAMLDAAAVPLPENMDGYSLLPGMTGNGESPREWIFMHFDPHRDQDESFATPARFIMTRDWKLYSDSRFFDLRQDLSEAKAVDMASFDTAVGGTESEQEFARLSDLLGQFPDIPFFHEAEKSAGEAEQ
jgi:arylsulfatase A-like enzyme